MKRALISVSDKTGIVEIATRLKNLNYEIVSTGGTLLELRDNKIEVIPVSEVTGFPEILNGRVKTLHPKIHGGLLYIRDSEKHKQEILENGIQGFDIVIVNLYPFEDEMSIENIDIGGPTMLRAAAKNYQYVTAIIDPDDYEEVIAELEAKGETSISTRQKLAAKVFAFISRYDKLIANFIAEQENDEFRKITLRYGENPHQVSLYQATGKQLITQLHGKELSYNNYLDIDAAIKTIIRFDKPTVAILKHTNPCGIASDDNITVAYKKAFATDTVSPFGGVVITNAIVDISFVNEIDKVFTEIVLAPDFTDEALLKLQKKKDRRLIKYDNDCLSVLQTHVQVQACLDDYIAQIPDLADDCEEEWEIVTELKPSENDLNEAKFAWQVVKMLKSNAICFTRDNQTIGMGIGQTSRIDSLNIAIERSKRMGFTLENSVCASDGFFPFSDSIETMSKHAIKTIIQPGGSKGDAEVIQACNKHKIAMIFTKRRHFRH